jgi:Tfp pilus assembly protein PilZ
LLDIRWYHSIVSEQRRFARALLDLPLVFRQKDHDVQASGIGRDISVGGMFIETENPAPFGSEVVVVTPLPGERGEFSLPGVVRWTKPEGMGVQFGLLGARETHLITEITRKADSIR